MQLPVKYKENPYQRGKVASLPTKLIIIGGFHSRLKYSRETLGGNFTHGKQGS